MGRTYHLHEFSRREDRIDIMSGILPVEQVHLTLAFLCHARHDGERKDLIRRNSEFFRKICLHDRTEHLLRGFRRGEVVHHIRKLALRKSNPARAA